MKCKRHPYESGPGICAPCLRDRLLALIAARDGRSTERRRNPDPSPPPFQRSASPLRSSADSCRPRRFFSTPQVGPTTAARSAKIDKKFSLFSAIFGFSRSDEINSSKSSSSWISHLISRKKNYSKSRFISRSFHDRGMSPARGHDDEKDSACSSGYSTESSTGLRRPEPTPVRRFPPPARHGRGVSGFAVCLSPLVRPNMKSAVDVGISGDPRGAPCYHHHHRRRHVPVGHGSLVPSGSRKLADYGRFR